MNLINLLADILDDEALPLKMVLNLINCAEPLKRCDKVVRLSILLIDRMDRDFDRVNIKQNIFKRWKKSFFIVVQLECHYFSQ